MVTHAAATLRASLNFPLSHLGDALGQMRHLASSAASHMARHGTPYLVDYVQAHIDLGLVVRLLGGALLRSRLAPLDAHKVGKDRKQS